MKEHRMIYCLFAILSTSLIISCLSESGQKIAMGNYPGVVVKQNDSAKIYLKGGDVVYSSQINSNVNDGDCVIIDFSLDYGKPENSDSGRVKGFYTVDINRLTPVSSQDILAVLTDTSLVLPDEHTLASVQQQHAFIRNRFFLFTDHRDDTLPLRFELSYDPGQSGTDKVYELFLRVTKMTEATPATQPKVQFNAFNLTDLSRRATDSLRFRINYVQSFNKDSTQINWTSGPVYRFAL
ncbi:MAG: hypothetical protein LBS88_09395 [Tannerellaceae bacterium]|jgi:hypothetical protein|nr:hypothetical protein [Tannerellaceae bacterium]